LQVVVARKSTSDRFQPARSNHAPHRLRAQLDGAAPEALAELIHAFVGVNVSRSR